jgi:hypothetical protein
VAVAEEQWIHKVTVKKSLKITEQQLVELVSQRILTPHLKHTNGKYLPMPFILEKNTQEWRVNRWFDKTIPVTHRQYVDITKEQIAEGLKRCLWFNQIEFDDAIYERKVNLPETIREETKITTLSQAGKKGGSAPKRITAIIEAIRIFLEEDHKRINKSDEAICNTFKNKYKGESKACHVEVKRKSWAVFFYDDCIFAHGGNNQERSIKLRTLRTYIADVKTSISQVNPINPS